MSDEGINYFLERASEQLSMNINEKFYQSSINNLYFIKRDTIKQEDTYLHQKFPFSLIDYQGEEIKEAL